MSRRRARGGREPDRIARLIRDRPDRIAGAALLSWLAIALVVWAESRAGVRWWAWALLAFPTFVATSAAFVSLFERHPERAGADALRVGLFSAAFSALIVGREAAQVYQGRGIGRIVLVCMASSAIGLVVGALAGPVIGWGARGAGRAARAFIRGVRGS